MNKPKLVFWILFILLLSISIEATYHKIGHCGEPFWALDLELIGSTILVPDDAGIHIIDVSEPNNPIYVSCLEIVDTCREIEVSGDIAYIANTTDGLLILDVSNPQSPQIIGSYNTPDCALSLVVSDSIVYIADRNSGLQIINVSDPQNPELVGSFDTPNANHIAISGTLIFLSNFMGNIQVIDVSDPSIPSLVYEYYKPQEWVNDIVIIDSIAYVATSNCKFVIYDVSDPTNFNLIATYETTYANRISISQNTAYLSCGQGGFQVLDISNIFELELIGALKTPACAYNVVISDNFAYITDLYTGGYSSAMVSNLNSGVSYFNYRGWLNMSGFGNSQIYSLNNGLKLPFAVFLTCGTGSFASGESRSEAFIRAGSAGSQKGAIAAIGTATSGTHTQFNNCIDAGIFYGIFADGIYNPGGAVNRGKLSLYLNYPLNPGNAVNIFSHWNTLMGDPGVELWTGVPQDMEVNYNTQVAVGTNYLEVIVEDTNELPLENAWVTALMGDDDIFATGYTDAEGMIILPIDAQIPGSVNLTVTKHNYIPHLGNFDIGNTDRFVNVFELNIDDDTSGSSSGNGNWIVNPGEDIELGVSLKNFGTSTANSVTATIFSQDDFITITDATEDYGNIAPGASVFSADDFDFSVANDVLGGTEIKLDILIEDALANQWTDVIYIPVEGANLYATDYTVIGDPNGILDPGETVELEVTLENLGAVAANGISGILSSPNNYIVIDDADGYFGNIAAGGQASNSSNRFMITANAQVIPGSQFTLELELNNAQGYNNTVSFPINVGTVSITDPVGPDAYGYYCYDDEDIDYFNVPTYDWIEINSIGTDLQLNDGGDTGDSETINLPITFRMYGEEYNTVTVCSNGWIAPGGSSQASFMNSRIPGPQGPSPMIAPFWDDLKNGSTGDVFWYYDNTQHYVVIEWDHMQNDYNGAEETFQAILYDANYYPTSTGDSEIKVQYKIINNVDAGGSLSEHGQYSSVGIEDHTGTVGLEYTFNNAYPVAAKSLQNQMALLFTGPPIPFEEPFLVLGGLIINDSNGNGQIDYAEDIGLGVTLNNLGENPATGVSAVISTTDPYITLIQDTADYNTISGGGSGTNVTDFELTIAEDCPDGHIAFFEMAITSNEDNWDLSFTLILNAPVIEFYSIFIDDGDDNILDPGETADIYVSFQNDGGADANNAIGEISESDPYVTLNSTTYNFGTFNSGSIMTAVYNVSVAGTAPIGHVAEISAEINADLNYINFTEFVLQIGFANINEGFESGDFENLEWEMSGSADWVISTDAIEGMYCAKSGTISHNQNSDLSVTLDIIENGEISFYRKVSSESNYDYLEFYINGVLQNEWAGTVGWGQVIFPVQQGTVTFRWSYDKDGSVSTGSDCAWIDDIIFPAGGGSANMGFVEGNVALNGGTGNVEDVNITAGSNLTYPDLNGDYIFPLPAGIYDVIASLDGYETVTENNVQVVANVTTTVDFELTYLEIPVNLSATVVSNDVTLEWEMPETSDISRQTPEPRRTALMTDRIRQRNLEANENIDSVTRSLTGFKVYRNGAEIAEITNPGTMTYYDEFLNAGNYSYYVTAVYDDMNESLPSNTEEITITLAPPTQLSASSQPPDIVLDWVAPDEGRNLTGYRVYRDEVEIAEVTIVTYTDENVPTGNYTYYVTAVYGNYESEPSNEVILEHNVDQEIIVIEILPIPGDVTINETENIDFHFSGYDPDGNPLEFSWELDGVEVSTDSTYTFETDYTSAGEYTVSLEVTDNFVPRRISGSDSRNILNYAWDVTVNDVDQAIVVNSINPDPGPVIIQEGSIINFSIDAYDPDGNPLDYNWRLDGVEVSITSTYDFITNIGSAGVYLVTLDVTDNYVDSGESRSDLYFEWNVTVLEEDQLIVVNDIQPPPGSITINETEFIEFYIDAYDPDGFPLDYYWEVDGNLVSTDSSYTFTTDYTSAGIYLIELEVTDNFGTENTIYFDWSVTVIDVDQPIVVNELIPPEGDITIDEGDVINFSINAYDPDGNDLEYSWQIDGVVVSTDSTYIFETGYTSAGEYTVTLEVTDNFGTRRISGSVSRNTLNYSWDVTVNDVDQPIVVNELIPPEGNIVIDEGDVINFSIDAYDPDGNELEYLWSVYSMAVSDSSSYDFITNENSAGEYEITLFVTDNFGTRDELNFLWNVTVNNVVGSDVVFIPVITKLYQNHPNPFNPVTSIKFDIKENETGVLSIFNLKGQIIESQRFNSGIHTYPWNADKRGSGIYFYRLHTESYSVVKKMLLLK